MQDAPPSSELGASLQLGLYLLNPTWICQLVSCDGAFGEMDVKHIIDDDAFVPSSSPQLLSKLMS